MNEYGMSREPTDTVRLVRYKPSFHATEWEYYLERKYIMKWGDRVGFDWIKEEIHTEIGEY